MRDFGKVKSTIWKSRKFRALTDDRARLMYLYLHTCPHGNSIGCFCLPTSYAAEDIGWLAADVQRALDDLVAVGLIGYDPGERLVRIVDFIKHSPITNTKHGHGSVRLALSLPDCAEKRAALADLARDVRIASDAMLAASIAEAVDRPIDRPIAGNHQPPPRPTTHRAIEGLGDRIPTETETQTDTGGGGIARARATETLVARFKELRLELWPNEPGFPAPDMTLTEQAAGFLGDDVPAAVLIETLERGMRAQAAQGLTAPVMLKAYRKSLADAAARFRNRKTEVDDGNPDRSASPVGAGAGGQWGHTRQHAAKSAALAGLDRAFGGRRD